MADPFSIAVAVGLLVSLAAYAVYLRTVLRGPPAVEPREVAPRGPTPTAVFVDEWTRNQELTGLENIANMRIGPGIAIPVTAGTRARAQMDWPWDADADLPWTP